MSLLDAALELAEQGVAVFPCGPDKAPRTPRGFHDATTDEAVIRGWPWVDAIGAAIAPGTIVVDVDPRNGGEGTLDLLKANGQMLPATYTVRTRSGGWHYYLTVPEDIALRGTLGPGIDIKRAGKGYVIAPPSEGYRALPSIQTPTKAPPWLLEELKVPEPRAGVDEASSPKFFPFESGTAYGLAGLERELGTLATAAEGGRNDALNKAAFSLAQLVAGGELEEERAREDLLTVAERIGLEDKEAHATLESGWRSGLEQPRQAPPRNLDEERTSPAVEALESQPDPEAEGRFWVDWNVDEPPPPFFLHPLLPKNAYVLVYGATEAAKSMTWLGILAQGSHRGVRSSFYSLENPPHTDRDRLRRWAPDPANFRLTNSPIDFNDPRQVEALARREAKWGADVILIDTYSHAFNSRSEDGNAKAIEFARRVRWVMAQVGCSVIVLDHTGFEGDEPRDASAKRQQVDVAILMKKEGNWIAGQSARFSMTNRKAARFANPFFARGEIRDVKDRGLGLAWTSGDRPTWPDS